MASSIKQSFSDGGAHSMNDGTVLAGTQRKNPTNTRGNASDWTHCPKRWNPLLLRRGRLLMRHRFFVKSRSRARRRRKKI